jgi:hypothetical protein
VASTIAEAHWAWGSMFDGHEVTTRSKQLLDYKLRVHTVPVDLRPLLPLERSHLVDARGAYQLAVESRLLWDVWMIDQFGAMWIAVSFENERGVAEFHTLRVDPGTYRKVACEAYEALVEGE